MSKIQTLEKRDQQVQALTVFFRDKRTYKDTKMSHIFFVKCRVFLLFMGRFGTEA